MREGSIIINCQLARTSWNRDNFFRFSRNFVIEVSPLFQTSPVSTKKNITVKGIDVFFLISDKGWKGKRKESERRKERAVEHQLRISRSSSRGSFLSGYQRTTRMYFNLSREYQLLTYSLDFSRTKIGSERLFVIYPLWREGEEVGRYRWLQWS